MFDHRLLATDGLYPGLTNHFSVAVLGAFQIEVIVIPPKQDLYGYHDLEYQIVIRVTRKGKVWETRRFVSMFAGKSLEKVVASFKGIGNLSDKVGAKVRFINSKVKSIFVKAKHHDTK